MKRQIIIGDIQGCFDEFEALLVKADNLSITEIKRQLNTPMKIQQLENQLKNGI